VKKSEDGRGRDRTIWRANKRGWKVIREKEGKETEIETEKGKEERSYVTHQLRRVLCVTTWYARGHRTDRRPGICADVIYIYIKLILNFRGKKKPQILRTGEGLRLISNNNTSGVVWQSLK
jgi:hypothetical protein